MINILRAPDDIKIECEADNADCTVETEIKDESLCVYIGGMPAALYLPALELPRYRAYPHNGG
ncbi:MAG: hypothetical protein ACLR56_10435 [Oscillospiraceae bacterium]